jgi:hypothetical protein
VFEPRERAQLLVAWVIRVIRIIGIVMIIRVIRIIRIIRVTRVIRVTILLESLRLRKKNFFFWLVGF